MLTCAVIFDHPNVFCFKIVKDSWFVATLLIFVRHFMLEVTLPYF